MKHAIEMILFTHKLLKSFNESEYYYVKLENQPFMSLCIEKHSKQVIISHYFEQNGDLIPDPDMEFEIVGNEWFPVAIQHATGAYFRAIDYRRGERFVSQTELCAQQEFSRQWAKNLLSQGFTRAKVVRAEVG